MSEFSGKHITVSEPHTHVYLLQFNRKPVNAFSIEFWTEYRNTLESIARHAHDPRVVVIASALPKIWTAGIDLVDLAGLVSHESPDPARKSLLLQEHITTFQRAISTPSYLPFPVISAVHGKCIGLGVDIITATDIRIAASSAEFAIKEADVGLAADIGTLSRISKITGNESMINELAYTATLFPADTALSIGLISRVVKGGQTEVLRAALDLAVIIASKSPIAIAGTKKLLLHARDHTVAQSLDYTAVWNSAMLNTEDLRECAMAAMTKNTAPILFQPLRTAAAKPKL